MIKPSVRAADIPGVPGDTSRLIRVLKRKGHGAIVPAGQRQRVGIVSHYSDHRSWNADLEPFAWFQGRAAIVSGPDLQRSCRNWVRCNGWARPSGDKI